MRRFVGMLAVAIWLALALRAPAITVEAPDSASPRVEYGIDRLRELKTPGRVVVRTDSSLAQPAEGFAISGERGMVHVTGKDDSGTLYGCLELARRLHDA